MSLISKFDKLSVLFGIDFGSDSQWEEKFKLSKDFVKKHDRLPSCHSKDKQERMLGSWIDWQKQYKKKGKLSKERQKKLNNINDWKWEFDVEKQWEGQLKLLKEFIKKHDKFPSYRSKRKEEKILAMWISHQKVNKNKLSQERQVKLNDINGWRWNLEDRWLVVLKYIKEFILTHNRFPSQHSKNKEEIILGRWVCTQKKNKKKENLSKKSQKLLNGIKGWKWEMELGEQWEKQFKTVIKFVKKHNGFPTSCSKNKEEKTLGYWISHQKVNKNKGELSKERQNKLENINDWRWKNIKLHN